MSEHQHHVESFVGALVNGDQVILSLRYVDALYALASKEDLIDVVSTDLRGLRRVWAESAEWRFVACDPRLSDEELSNAVNHVARISDLDDLTLHFLLVVAKNRRLSILPLLIETFLEEAAKRRGEFRADVRTARELTTAQHEALAASLNAAAGGKVHMTVTKGPVVVGGAYGQTWIEIYRCFGEEPARKPRTYS